MKQYPIAPTIPYIQIIELGTHEREPAFLRDVERIDLRGLSESGKEFWKIMKEYLLKNIPWLTFDRAAFGPRSPIHKGQMSQNDSLFRALTALAFELGVAQNLIKRSKEASVYILEASDS